MSKGQNKWIRFTPYTKGLKMSYERVRPQESGYKKVNIILYQILNGILIMLNYM